MAVNGTNAPSDWIFLTHADHGNNTHEFVNFVPVWYKAVYVFIAVSLSIVTVVANICVFVTVLGHESLRTPTNSLLLSLAAADTLAGGVMFPMYVARTLTNSQNRITCQLRKFLFVFTSACSLTSLCVVSVDRMLAISYPYFYVRKMTSRTVKTIIFCVWIFCAILCSFTFLNWQEWDAILNGCNVGIPRPLYLIVTPPAFYLSGVIILLAYIKIYLVARRHRVQIQTANEPSVVVISQSSEAGNIPVPGQRKSTISTGGRTRKLTRSLIRDLKAARTVSILVGVFLCCWCPTAFFYIYVNSKQIHIQSSKTFFYMSDSFMLLSFLNSCLDPILYSVLNRDIRARMKKLVWIFRIFRH